MMVAVEMITYNHEPYIRQAIESILMQKTDFDFCLYIFEDCSTDNTAAICREYAAKYPELIKANLNKVNIGVVKNATLMHETTFASGARYIAMCEGDDYWADPVKLQKQVDFLEASPDYVICFHRVYELTDDGKLSISHLNVQEDERTFSLEDLAQNNFLHTPSVVFRNALQLPAWFGKSPVGDYVLHMLNARYGLIKYFPDPMAVYRIHRTSTWSSLSKQKMLESWYTVLSCLLTEEFSVPIKETISRQRRITGTELLKTQLEENYASFLQNMEILAKEDPELGRQWLLEHYPNYIQQIRQSKTYKFSQQLSKFKSSISRLTSKI